MFHHKSKGKRRTRDNLFSSQARSGKSADLFVVMILLNFYLYVIIYY
jgi:hypothetical protein